MGLVPQFARLKQLAVSRHTKPVNITLMDQGTSTSIRLNGAPNPPQPGVHQQVGLDVFHFHIV